MKDNSRKTQLHFVVSEQELDRIRQRMEECGVTNLSAFLRKMALDGYIIHLDMTELQALTRLLRICSNNLNQYAKRANEVGSVYAADVEDLHSRLDEIWELTGKLLQGFANIP